MPVLPEYDCLIVGGGLVGASLACALATASLRIGVIEAVPFEQDLQPSYDDRGLVLAPASQRILSGLGLWAPIAAEATPIERIHVSDRGRFGFTRLKATEIGMSALGHVVVARTLGKALVARLSSHDTVDLLCPARLESLELQPAQVKVGISQEGRCLSLTTRLLVAADGGDSEVRRQFGIQTDIQDYRQTAVVANVTPERSHSNTAYERFTSTGPLAVLPLADQRCVAVWVVRTEQAVSLMALEEEAFLADLTARFGRRLGRFIRLGRRRSYPLRLTRATQQTGHRSVLIGNAAHTIHPNAAQGLNLGLRDVATLAELLIEAKRSGADLGGAELLRRYYAWRRPDQLETVGFSHGLAQLFYNDFLPLVVNRDLAMLAIDLIPPLKYKLMRRAMGITGHPPRLVRGLPL
jgi:2-octaprenyl-6-methoxyphenol hydroxylase